VVAADPAARHDHGRGTQLEVADNVAGAGRPARRGARSQPGAAHTDDGAALHDEGVDAVTVQRRHEPCLHAGAHGFDERLEDAGAGAPGDVEPGHGVAVFERGVTAAFGPADHREEPEALLPQPGPLLSGGEGEVGLGPTPRPVVFLAVEPGAGEPVLPGQIKGVVHAQATLLRRVDEEQPAERPPGLPAKGGGGFLLDEEHSFARVDELGRCDEPGEAGPHDDDIGFGRG